MTGAARSKEKVQSHGDSLRPRACIPYASVGGRGGGGGGGGEEEFIRIQRIL